MEGRTAVVTGGSGGIGRAIAKALLAEGFRVGIAGRDPEALEEARAALAAPADRLESLRFDVRDELAVERAFEAFGPVDVLVNNAGRADAAPIGRQTLEAWRDLLDVNATGAFLCSRAVLPGMKERGFGRIVMLASTAGLRGYAYTSAYSASKHAMLGLMRALAAETQGTGITVNAVCPTFVRTRMTEESIRRIVEATGRGPEEAEADLTAGSLLGRLLEPGEVARAVVFCATDAEGSMNGRTIVLDGCGG